MADMPIPVLVRSRDTVRMARYKTYLDYYEGRQGLVARGDRGSTVQPVSPRRSRSLVFNYARAVVEKGASYLVTEHKPVVDPAGGELATTAQAELDAVWKSNDLARLDFETEVDTAVLGDGAFKVVWDDQTERVVVTAPDVQGLYVWCVGDDIRRLWRVVSCYSVEADQVETLFGSKAVTTKRSGDLVPVHECWTADEVQIYVNEIPVRVERNPYGAIPYVVYPNLPRPKEFWGSSDIESLTEPLDELNRAFSQLSRILELSGNPIAVLENVEGSERIEVQPGATWELPQDAKAYLLDLLQGGGVRLHVDYVGLVYQALHDMAELPRIAFGESQGVRSGVSFAFELDPLLRRVARKRLIRTAALVQRDQLILRVLGHHTGRDFSSVDTDIEWAPVFTRDETGMLVSGGWEVAPSSDAAAPVAEQGEPEQAA